MIPALTHALRFWNKSRGVALLAIAALAIGIGSATAIFTVVEAILLRPLQYENSDRYAALFGAQVSEPGRYSSVSLADLQDYKSSTQSFDVFGVFQPAEFSLSAPGQPQHLKGVEISPDLPASTGVPLLRGRWFGSTQAEQGKTNLAVISQTLWRRFGSDPAIVGATLTMNGRAYVVTGVAPASFRLPVAFVDGGEYRAEVWVPLDPQGSNARRDVFSYFAYVRLKPNVTLAQAQADVARVARTLVTKYPQMHGGGYTAVVVNLKQLVVKEIRPTLLLLFGAVIALLAITCANVAGLLLSLALSRARETAIRSALGASRIQLASQYLTEGLALAIVGAAGGVLVALALLRFLLSVALDTLPRADGIGINAEALAFAFLAALFCSLLFSLAPLRQSALIQPQQALSEGVRASSGATSLRLSRGLVVSEIALSFALLSVSVLLIGHFKRLLETPSGFEPKQLMSFTLRFSDSDYPNMPALIAYRNRLLSALRAVPGVTNAAIVNQLPVEGCCFVTTLFPEGSGEDNDPHNVSIMLATHDYFKTMAIPVVAGRLPDEGHDQEGSDLAIVIDKAAASRFFPGRSALGARAEIGKGSGHWGRIVAVVGSVRNNGLGKEPIPELFLPSGAGPFNPMRFVVRSPLGLAVLVPAIRAAVRQVNPTEPVYNVETMDEVFLESLSRERLQCFLISFFAAAALLMACLGVYGVVAYAVRQRTVEIGTRMALGALPANIFRMVVASGLSLSGFGILLGSVAVLAISLVLRSQVFGVQLDNPVPFLASALLVALLGTSACLLPASRAALVSPLIAIRDDAGSLWGSLSDRVSSARRAEGGKALDEGAVLSEFVEASRGAESLRDALQQALRSLSEALGVASAELLAREEGGFACAAAWPPGIGPCRLPLNGLLAGRVKGLRRPLPLSREDFDAWLRSSDGHAEEIAQLQDFGATLAAPLLAKRELTGILILGPRSESGWSSAEKSLLRNCAAQFALMLENMRLSDRMLEQEKLRRDVQLAVEVQKRLFPDRPPSSAAVSLAGISIPARSVGGDYYDFISLPDRRIGIALADVAGKGVAAALVMSVVQASLRILVTEPNLPLAELASRMNRHLHRSTGTNSYATFFYGQIDEENRRFHYVNAGHNPPYLLRYSPNPIIEELPAGGTVIGLFPQLSCDEATIDLNPGDVLIAFTDGVPEALNPQDEEFGEDRVRQLLHDHGHLPVDEIANRLTEELKTWIADAVQYDDLTFILMKVNA